MLHDESTIRTIAMLHGDFPPFLNLINSIKSC